MVESKKNSAVEFGKKYRSNKLIIVLTIILIVVSIISLVYNSMNNGDNSSDVDIDKVSEFDDVIINTNEGVVDNKEEDGLKFTNISLTSKDGNTYLATQVMNTTGEDYYLDEFHIIIKDENGEYLVSYFDSDGNEVNYLIGYVGDVIKAGGSEEIITSIDQVIADTAYTVEYEIVK